MGFEDKKSTQGEVEKSWVVICSAGISHRVLWVDAEDPKQAITRCGQH